MVHDCSQQARITANKRHGSLRVDGGPSLGENLASSQIPSSRERPGDAGMLRDEEPSDVDEVDDAASETQSRAGVLGE